MIVNNSLDEIKKRDNALSIIRNMVENGGRSSLYDLTGLSGGFIASPSELSLLETYVGPAIFEDALQEVGIEHMGGDKVIPLNRTSSGILATILTLVNKNSNVVHYLAELPAHPSIPRSCKLVGANYSETDNFNEFSIPENTSLVVITGSTMDHKVIDENEFREVIEMAHARNIPVMVDDASGARLRTVIFNQPRACDLGADIAITSTDKLMPGPRGGLMAGREDLIDEIKVKVNQFGLEAQPPAVLAMVNGIKNFNEDNLINSFEHKEQLFELLNKNFNNFQKTPTGVMISPNDLAKEILGSMGKIATLHKSVPINRSLAVLKAPDIPSLLIETGYLSNPDEASLLATGKYQRTIAHAIYLGIKNFVYKNKDTLRCGVAAQSEPKAPARSNKPASSGAKPAAQSGAKPAAPSGAKPVASEKTVIYVVKKGDTLSKIAQDHKVSPQRLKQLNGLTREQVNAGQRLKVPKKK